MRILVTDITWQKTAATLPTQMRVELEDDTPAEDMANQIKYALWRATNVMPVSFEQAEGVK